MNSCYYSKVRNHLELRRMMRIKTEFAEGKFNSDRSAGVLSEPNPLKAVRRVLRDKEREGVAKGRESATETFAPLIFCMRPCEKRITKAPAFVCIPNLGKRFQSMQERTLQSDAFNTRQEVAI